MQRIIFILIFSLLAPEAFAKICNKGIPCGNTCIAAWKTCHVGRGTAVHISETQYQTNNYSQNLNTIDNPKPTEVKLSQIQNEKKCNFRSYGSSFFLCDTNDSKILKCNGYCPALIGIKKGTKINFFDDLKLIEFDSIGNTFACDIQECSEVKN